MRTKGDVSDLGLTLIVLCELQGWSLRGLSRKTGIDHKLISGYVRGTTRPTLKTMNRIAEAFELEPPSLEQLVHHCQGLRLAFERAIRQGLTGNVAAGEATPGLEQRIGSAAQEALAPFLFQWSQLAGESAARPNDRAWAEALGSKLEALPAEDQSLVVDVLLGDDRTWALAERLCLASTAAAAHRADETLRLARLALRVAEHVPGPETWRLRLLGWVEPFVANALRASGDLAAAETAYARADDRWKQGDSGDPAGLLDGARRRDLKASLLM
ncbi:MAG TPA: helix-turn-helix transcriptional regulator [Thermoanaerobaculia bacterium]